MTVFSWTNLTGWGTVSAMEATGIEASGDAGGGDAFRGDASGALAPGRWHRARERWSRPLAAGVVLLMLAATAYGLSVALSRMESHPVTYWIDYHSYIGFTQRWLDGQGFYLAEQLAGPYDAYTLSPPLYPPPFVLLMVPFLWLPAILWWALPLATIAVVVVWWRPRLWAWVVIAVLVAWPRTYEIVLYGNPVMWAAAFAALGTIWAWPYVGVLIKPSLLPFALLGIRHRSWWVALGIAALVCIPFGTMWLDYATAVRNANLGLLYSIRDVSILLIPIVAKLGSSKRMEAQRAGVPAPFF